MAAGWHPANPHQLPRAWEQQDGAALVMMAAGILSGCLLLLCGVTAAASPPLPICLASAPQGHHEDAHPVSHPPGEQQSCHQQGLAKHGFNPAFTGAMNKAFKKGQMGHAGLATLLLQTGWLLRKGQRCCSEQAGEQQGC